MAGGGRKKATKKKKKSSVAATPTATQEGATSSVAATPTTSIAATPTTSEVSSATATPTSSVARDCVAGALNVQVRYVDSPISFWVGFQAESPAEIAVQVTGCLGVETYAKMLGTNSSNLHAEPTYPAVLADRKLTVSQWSKIGHKPFVAVSPTETSGFGLHAQKLAALEELGKCREEKMTLMDAEAARQAQEKIRLQETPGCERCVILLGILHRLEEKIDKAIKNLEDKEKIWEDKEKKWEEKEKIWEDKEKKWEEKETKWEEKDKQISNLLRMVEDLRKVRRRNIIERARAKVVHKIGMRIEDVESWHQFFTENEHAILQLGMSERLFSLLKAGKRQLHKVVHETFLQKMADSVLSLDAKSNERRQYEDAFQFAFDLDVLGFFNAPLMDESDIDL